ncbi:MAG TPA: tetratricopeptide repeat protein [Flavobacteriales bacterium]|nr:tetratricopeptide repeat protein [Flavobacteriales bacterium]
MKRLFLCFLILLPGIFCSAQKLYNLDSLKQVAAKNVHDTSKINCLLLLSEALHTNNPDSAEIFVSQGWYLVTKALERKSHSKKVRYKLNHQLAEVYNILGVLYDNRGDSRRGLSFYIKSKKQYEKIKDEPAMASQLNNIGYVYMQRGDIKKAISYWQKCLAIYNRHNRVEDMEAIYNNLGFVYFRLGNKKKAFDYFEKCLAMRRNSPNQLEYAKSLHNVAVARDMGGDSVTAMKYFMESIEIKKKYNDKTGTANSLNEVAYMYKRDKKYKRAHLVYDMALKLMQEAENAVGICTVLGSIGHLYMLEGNLQKAAEYDERSALLAKQRGLADQYRTVLQQLYKIYEKLGNYRKAFDTHVEYIAMQDSIVNDQNKKAMVEQEISFKYEKKSFADSMRTLQREKIKDAKNKANLAWQRRQNIALIIFLVLVVIVALLSFRAYNLKKKSNKEISLQKAIIESKNHEIMDSITYAKRLQEAILPSHELLEKNFAAWTVLYKPKDIVAGDFYWMEETKENIIVAVADCTGHGVPGAMVSVVGANALNRCVKEFGLEKPNEILDKLSQLVEETFTGSKNANASINDGMDISLIAMSKKSNKLWWSGANNPLVIARNGECIEKIADKQPVGKFAARKPFTLHEVVLEKNDTIWLFTDGYADQFGGKEKAGGKKFKYSNFKKVLLESTSTKGADQNLDAIITQWQGELEQTDDICVMGLKRE